MIAWIALHHEIAAQRPADARNRDRHGILPGEHERTSLLSAAPAASTTPAATATTATTNGGRR